MLQAAQPQHLRSFLSRVTNRLSHTRKSTSLQDARQYAFAAERALPQQPYCCAQS